MRNMPPDISSSDSIVAMIVWIQAAMLGSIATVIAGLSVAIVGGLMLTGRLNWRRGATVVVGCFVLFGAPRIAAGIRNTLSQSDLTPTIVALPPPDFGKMVKVPSNTSAPSAPYDPYAGAAVQRPSQPLQ
jgi:type IV secretion system protein VirB2